MPPFAYAFPQGVLNMKVVLGLCFLALIASALADCGCLKCNPHLQVVSPRYSPCKVIYRNNNLNVPSVAPYKLQAAIPPPPPVFVPKEYDYQMQYLPYATPYTGSVYEYDLQAAIPPPPGPLHIPLKNLRTGVERVVMDAPYNALGCGSANCHPGFFKKAPLPIHLHHHHHHDCECNSCRQQESYGCNSYERNSYGRDSCGCNSCECDSCNRDRSSLLKDEDNSAYKGPIIEPILPPLCSRYAQNLIENFIHNSQNNVNCKKFRRKRDIIDLPMNFMFKFVPNLLRGPIIHAFNTIQHNANPTVARARLNANKHRIQAHLARAKHKFDTQKGKHHIPFGTTKTYRQNHSPSISNLRKTVEEENMNPHLRKIPHTSNIKLHSPHQLIKPYHSSYNAEDRDTPRAISSKKSNRLYQNLDIDAQESLPSRARGIYPNLGSKYNIDEEERANFADDFVGNTNQFLKELFSVFSGKPRIPREHKMLAHQHHLPLDEMKSHFHQKGYSDEDIRDILLTKMQKFNEMYERRKRSVHTASNKSEDSSIDDVKGRRKRAVLLDTDQFQLPFFEIEDELLDNYNEDSENQVVGMKHKKRKRRKHYEDSEMESGEEILGSGHPLHDHPFVVLLRTPLKLLHHFHDIRKNFQPILYSFPKILQSSRRYLKDFGKNLQTGVLDFASNLMGDFSNQIPKRYDSFLLPSRHRRSLTEDKTKPGEPRKRDKRYILKVVDEKEVQEFLEEKLGGYFDDEEEEEEKKEEDFEEKVGNAENKKEKTGEKKFVVKKLSPKLILDNNGKPFIEINGNKRPLFFGKNKHKSPLLQKSKQKTHESNSEEKKDEKEEKDKEEDTKHEVINGKIDEIISQAKQKLREGEILKSVNCDEMPTQTIKEKINQISSYIQDLVNLDCSKYASLFDNLSKLEKMRKSIAEYWKKVMINEKTNDIQCKIKILKSIREMQNEKDEATKKIAEFLKEGDNFIVKKLIKLLVRLQKLQCLIQKIVDHFENRMKIGTISDTEKEIKFVDYLSSLSFESAKTEEEFVCSLKKEKHASLHRAIQFLENLRLLLQKDDTYITNEVAKQIWEMKNIEKLQIEAIEEMNVKLEDNMKIRKELKILFDLLKQIETSEDACEKLLQKIGESNIVGSKLVFKSGKRQTQRQTLSEILEKIRENAKSALAARKLSRKT